MSKKVLTKSTKQKEEIKNIHKRTDELHKKMIAKNLNKMNSNNTPQAKFTQASKIHAY